ncbi:glycosyltransferase [bacterium]|nr:glycosyltransferase [bacterium]
MSARPLRSLLGVATVQALGYLATLGWHLLLARSVEPELYGLIAFSLALILSLQVLLAGGYPAALIRFLPTLSAEDKNERALFLRRRAVNLILASGTLAMILAWLLHWRVPQTMILGLSTRQLLLILATGFASSLLNLGTAALIGLRKPVQGAFVGGPLIHLLILPTMALALYSGWAQADGLLIILLVVHALAGLSSAFLIWKPGARSESGRNDYARFARRSLGIGLVILGLSYLDRIMIGWLGNFSEVAIYSIPARLARLLYVLIYLLNPLMGPLYSRHLNAAGKTRALSGYRNASLLMAALATPLALIFIFQGRVLLGLAVGDLYAEGAGVLVLLTLGAMAVTWSGNNAQLLQMGGREGGELSMSLSALGLNFVLNLLLIPRMGALGAAWATFISLMITVAGRAFLAWRTWRALPGALGSVRLPLALAAFLAAHFLSASLPWPIQSSLALLVYLIVIGTDTILRALRHLEFALSDARSPRLVVLAAPSFALSRAHGGWWRRLKEAGFQVFALAPPGREDHAAARAEGIETRVLPMARKASPIRDLFSLLRLFGELARLRPDILQFSTPKASLLGALAGRMAGVPERVYLLRGRAYENFEGWSAGFYRRLEKLICSSATVVVPVSAALGEALTREGLCSKEKIRLLGSGSSAGVNVHAFDGADGIAMRRELGIAAGERTLLYVGWLRSEKGIDTLLEAFLRLKSAHLILAGELYEGDPLKAETLAAMKEHPRVHCLGWREDLPSLYAAADVVVHPSLREGFPRVLLEAAAAGRAAVCSDWPGAEEAVLHGETGLIVKRGDAVDLALALESLLDAPHMRERMGRAARARVEKSFDREMVLDLHTALLLERIKEDA